MVALVLGQLYAVCACTVTYVVQCAGCPERVSQEQVVPAGEIVGWGYLPARWVVVQGQPYCPRHRIEVT